MKDTELEAINTVRALSDIGMKNRNTTEFLGLMASASPFIKFVSASRLAMLAHHLTQSVTPKETNIPRVLTGLESQLEAFNIVMPVPARIISVHKRFRAGQDKFSIRSNPSTILIFQCQETGAYDCIDLTTYYNKHLVYGIKYEVMPIVNRIMPNDFIAQGTILVKSPNVKEGGIYSNTLTANVANIALPGTIEDGYVVSESFCQRGSLMELNNTVASWGRKAYPLNLYGDDVNYKPFPDVGDQIRPDGLIMALRTYDDKYNALEMDCKSLQKVDMIHDTRFYGPPNAIVYDVLVESGIGESKNKMITPPPMAEQAERYIGHLREYYNGILRSYDDILKTNKNPILSPRLIQLIARAIADTPNTGKHKTTSGGIVRRTYKRKPLDEYRVEVSSYRYLPLNRGSKLTGKSGDKGVICDILPDSHMPVDVDGNRADVIKFEKSAVSRLNPGQLYEQWFAAVIRDMGKWITVNYPVLPFNQVWDKLLAFYQAAAPLNYEICISKYTTEEKQRKHILSIIDSGIYLTVPPDSEHLNIGVIRKVEQVIKPTYGPVSYVDKTGKRVTTKVNCFIGQQQFMILEKSDLNPMSISSGYINHHGLLVGANKSARIGHPAKTQSIKVTSETEFRSWVSIMGPEPMVKHMAISNSPDAHKEVVKQILQSDTPSNLTEPFKVPKHTSRAMRFVKTFWIGFGLDLKSKNKGG